MNAVSTANVVVLRDLGMALCALADALSESEIDRDEVTALTDRAHNALNSLSF